MSEYKIVRFFPYGTYGIKWGDYFVKNRFSITKLPSSSNSTVSWDTFEYHYMFNTKEEVENIIKQMEYDAKVEEETAFKRANLVVEEVE